MEFRRPDRNNNASRRGELYLSWIVILAALTLLATGSAKALEAQSLGNYAALILMKNSEHLSSDEADLVAHLINRAQSLDRNGNRAMRLLPIVYLRIGDDDSAIELLSSAIEAPSNDKLSYYLRGTAYYEARRYTDAAADWTKAGFLTVKIQLLIAEAQTLMKHGDANAAEVDLKAAVELMPSDPTTYYALGGFYWGDPKRREDAAAALRGGLRQDRSSSFSKDWAEARLYILEGRWLLASQVLQRAALERPENGDVHTLLGYALWQNQQVGEAVSVLEDVVRRWPSNFDAYLYLSTIAAERGQLEDSKAYIARYLQYASSNSGPCPAFGLNPFAADRGPATCELEVSGQKLRDLECLVSIAKLCGIQPDQPAKP